MKVRPITSADISTAADALARAFTTDPFCVWLLGDDGTEGLRKVFAAQLKIMFVPNQLGWITDEPIGAALWGPQRRARLSENLRMAPVFLRVAGLRRAREAAAAFSEMERRHPKDPHHYLSILGVDPDHQRSGAGSALLRDGFARADAEGLPIYLETSNPDNVPYYQAHGLEVTTGYDLPHGGPHMWGLMRQASGSDQRT